MTGSYVLEEYYRRYLTDIRKLSPSSVNHYTQALRTVSRYLVKYGKIKESIYEINDLEEVSHVQVFLYQTPEFLELDKRGHQMYSSGLNNYYRFVNGAEFKDINQDIALLDFEAAVPDTVTETVTAYRRSSIIKIHVIESNNYSCEIDTGHKTFKAKSTDHQYMEGHHVIPMKKQDLFNKSLDIYANVVCLCPTCHRLLHYGVENDKRIILDKIYYERSTRLANSGIKISKNDFLQMAL